MLDTIVAQISACQTAKEARPIIKAAILELTDLKSNDPFAFRLLINEISGSFVGKGKGSLVEDINNFVKVEINRRTKLIWEQAVKDTGKLDLVTNEKGVHVATQANMVKLLENNKHFQFVYDTLSDRALFKFADQPIWRDSLEKHKFEVRYLNGDEPVTYYHIESVLVELKLYLGQFFPAEREWRELKDAIDTVALRNVIDIYQNWKSKLPDYDSEEHMDFFYRYFGVQDKQWAKTAARVLMLSMMARCDVPGYDCRCVVIIEGPQNSGKSRFVKLLAFHPVFAGKYVFHNKNEGYETARQLLGNVITEIPDGGNMSNRDQDGVKALLSDTEDVNRRMRANEVESNKRRGPFVMTTNNYQNYLKDYTGNTRFVPVLAEAEKINFEALELELPQIFAQAKHMWECFLIDPKKNLGPRLSLEEEQIQTVMLKSRELKPIQFNWVTEYLKNDANRELVIADGGIHNNMEHLIATVSAMVAASNGGDFSSPGGGVLLNDPKHIKGFHIALAMHGFKYKNFYDADKYKRTGNGQIKKWVFLGDLNDYVRGLEE